jgi:hypothetical protein
VRRKIPKSSAAKIKNYLEPRLPPGADLKAAMDFICHRFREGDRDRQVPPERIDEVLQGIALNHLAQHYLTWRREASPEMAVGRLLAGFLGQLDYDKAEHADRNRDVEIAVQWMGPACAEALFLRDWMGFADENRRPNCCEHRNGVRGPRTRPRRWLHCGCAGHNGFNDRQIAEAIGMDKDQVPVVLTNARQILDRRMKRHEREDCDE